MISPSRLAYQAIAAVLLGGSQFADADVHLGDARALFPGEAWLAFDLGCLNETWAAPEFQQIACWIMPSHRDSG